MPLVVRAFPLRRPVQELQAFVAALSTERKTETAEFYRTYGISHECWDLQQTSTGPWVICVTLVDEVAEASSRYARLNAQFERWFKSQVQELSGINPDEQPLGPPTSRLFVWSDEQRADSSLRL